MKYRNERKRNFNGAVSSIFWMCSDNKTLLISSHIFYMRKSLKLHAIIIYLGYKIHEKIIYTSQHIFYIMWPILIEYLDMWKSLTFECNNDLLLRYEEEII